MKQIAAMRKAEEPAKGSSQRKGKERRVRQGKGPVQNRAGPGSHLGLVGGSVLGEESRY